MRLPGAVASAGGGPASDGGQASLVSWNLLAPEYADPAKYPWASAAHLSWEARAPRIVERIGELDADAVALQEVPLARWDALYAELQPLGYDAELQTLSRGSARRGHPVANAVLLKSDRLRCVRAESRSRALITVLAARTAGAAAASAAAAPPLVLANVHLEAGAEKAKTRFNQLRSLLKRVQLLRAAGEPFDALPAAAPLPLVLAGDFNFDRSSPLHRLLAAAEPPPQQPWPPAPAPAHWSALLPLCDAYAAAPPPWGPPLRASYRNGRLLDFVWTSPAVELLRTMPVPAAAGAAQPRRWPSEEQPSDHLPVGALLSWAGAPPTPCARRCAWQQLFVQHVTE
jgi:endonuclease/exonuclease/phosphatase family metal-dependent hydrolase